MTLPASMDYDIELDSGWTLNNHLNTEFLRNDNLHLIFIKKITKSYQSYLSVKLSPFKLHFDVRIYSKAQ